MIKNKALFFFVILKVLLVYYFFFISQKSSHPKIVIVQIATHPALNTVVSTIKSSIKDFCRKNKYDIVCKNADGNIINMEMLATDIVNDTSVTKVVAIGSPALQSLIGAAVKYKRSVPIIFGAVTNPQLCNIDSYQYVRGISDQIDFKEVRQELEKIGCGKKIGFLCGSGDVGSVYTFNQLEGDASYKLISFGCSIESEVIQAAESACQKVDILFIPTDNMIASAIESVRMVAKKYNVPLFMTDKILFERGGDYFSGVDYRKHGEQVAALVRE